MNFWKPDRRQVEQAMQDTAWADGLRGIAAIGVVSSHLVLCYARALIRPCCAEGSNHPYLFQRPIFRLVTAGHAWVAIFFILSGFVNALKPLKLVRSQHVEAASHKLTLSAFARIFRLALPATTATIISWILCQLGAFETARQSDAFWLNSYTPLPSPSIYQALCDLATALKRTWMLGFDNAYDQPQWALIYLLQGSLMIIGGLSIVINMTPAFRFASLCILCFWSLDLSRSLGDPFVGLTCFSGIMLSEFSQTSIPENISYVSTFVSPISAILGLVLMSYANTNPPSATWDRHLYDFGLKHLPLDNEGGLTRTYASIGGIILVFSIITSPHMRWLLSRKALKWLGSISFAIYLLHGMVLRSVFSWMLFLGAEKMEFRETGADGVSHSQYRYPVPGNVHCAVATILTIPIILGFSHIWNMKMEPVFGMITSTLEKLVSGQLGGWAIFQPHRNGNPGSEKESLLPVRTD